MLTHVLKLSDLKKEEFDNLFKLAAEMKKRHAAGNNDPCLTGKSLGLIFEKPSTRTRVSFETAVVQLGGTPIFISAKDTQIARNEPVKDTIRVLSRYMDALAIRTFSQDLLMEYAAHSTIPIINALTDLYHPCQVLSDLLTVIEKKGHYTDLNIVWVGDGNNVAHSWINAAAVLDFNLTLACPEHYVPKSEILTWAQERSQRTIQLVHDPIQAVKNADVIYTDVWASMGQEDEKATRMDVFMPYQVNARLVAEAAPDVMIMHCLPAHRDEEITDEVLEGPQSVVWDQAENKLHMHKAILAQLM